MKFYSIISFLLFIHVVSVQGQQADSLSIQLKDVTITGYKNESARLSPLNISSINLDSTQALNSFNLCDLLRKTEGVSMLSTGVGIAKPVIRGLYGNRILILLNGLRFDNQQWQEEHGLGLTGFGLSRVELIKGPLGILYGTEALGGVINLIEEERPKANSRITEASLTLNSNTRGGLLQAAYLESRKNKWWRIRIGSDNHADYSDGRKQRILNSRFDGYYAKATFGFERKNWVSTANYAGSFNRFGFIFNDIYTFITPDRRWSRRLSENPAHLVLLNCLSSENKIVLRDNLKLFANVGVQSNKRMENEGGGAISLNMHLLTLQTIVKLDYTINERHKLIFSTLHSYEDNTNYGARKIVPDATLQESNLSLNHEINLNDRWIIENGMGLGEKKIKTFFTPGVNGQGKEIQPFRKVSPYYNFFSGLSFHPNSTFSAKLNMATGVRVANLAELSSNGLHEGVFTYEIGNPGLRNEKIYSANGYFTYDGKLFSCSISPFYNYFHGYIYLSPTNEKWFGFPVYRYKQQDAQQYGMELSFLYRLHPQVNAKASYSGMNSRTMDGHYTPFIPAQKITPQMDYRWTHWTHYPIVLQTNLDCVFAQNHTAPYEISTAAYTLWNAGLSIQLGSKKASVGLNANNLLNKAYTDHLSRFKNYGLLNIGRQFVVSVKYSG